MEVCLQCCIVCIDRGNEESAIAVHTVVDSKETFCFSFVSKEIAYMDSVEKIMIGFILHCWIFCQHQEKTVSCLRHQEEGDSEV